MKDYIRRLIKEQAFKLSLLLIMVIICLNAFLVIYYRHIIIRSSEISQQIQLVRDGLSTMETNIHLGDLAVRAYLIKPTQQFLDPFTQASGSYLENLNELENNLKSIGYNVANMAPARETIINYMQTLQLMVDLCDEGRTDEALEIFYEDRGLTAWQRYGPFVQDANNFISELRASEQEAYKGSIDKILVIQILLILFSLPILIGAFRQIVKDNRFRIKIFQLIDSSNKNNLYDDGMDTQDKNQDDIITSLVTNLRKASSFINSITNGNYDIEWEGMDKKIAELNKENIAGELIMMRDQMIKARRQDEIRLWTNEGLSKFADLIRNHQNDLHQLSEELISNIAEYLGAQQGGLFFATEDEQNETYLELMGCYAYQRKKFLEKRIELGQGMVGQCFLEGETSYITNIPNEYVNITSGLGLTNPKTLLIVPLKINEEVVGVVEIASLKEFEKYQIEFMERLAETVASAIASVRVNERTRLLLEQSQQQAEEMKAQEEEMRQNMEELQATQEQMHRKNEEIEKLLQQASENEESMKLQMEALEELQEEAKRNAEVIKKDADNFKHMLIDILNELPQKIFLKDAEGKMYIANQKVADTHGMPLAELIGKSDYDFVDKKTADEWRAQELEIMKKGAEKYVFEELIGGKKRVLESTKKIFNIRTINQVGLLGIQNDITDRVELQKRRSTKGKS